MTQLQPNSTHEQAQTASSSQPADLSSIYRSLGDLLSGKREQSIPNPLSLIALITHSILISHSFAPKATHSDDHLQTLLLADHTHSTLLAYSHPRSSLSFEFTLSKIGNRISIAGIAVEDDRLSTLDLSISEYLDPAEFPLTLTKEHQTNSIGLRSTTHLLDFLSLFVNRILSHLLPDLIPPTSPNHRSPPASSSATTTTPASRPVPESFVRPQVDRQAHHPSILEIGRSDLDPIGTSNLHIPSLYNAPTGGPDSRSGMLVGGNHPIFNRQPPLPGRIGGGGGLPGEFLPPGAVPPGARFDPFGPGFPATHPGFGSDLDPMGGLGQGLPLRNPHHGFSSSRPDFNDFRPPGGHGSGYDDMFM
ncbi:hypothetical protein PTTG_02270 [Puccinia triticina 1-1 BBBD Race 1]|uniref:Proteasome inhibitor PI31 subunit n=1 Tax=Puccinia triticina (isolate 1-1 / race 1 (BBBD)) TaxID=630390 RepID=A0A0C4ENC9_PUCT1|nr:hypothetical protein PTTG_02270 [Puccinia triticina 1-1 BBBD Race 1]